MSVLRVGLNALGSPSFVHDVATGAILFAVVILDGLPSHSCWALCAVRCAGPSCRVIEIWVAFNSYKDPNQKGI